MSQPPTPAAPAPPAAPLILMEEGPRGGVKYTPHILNVFSWLQTEGYGVHRPAAGVVDIYRRRPDMPVVERAHDFEMMRAVDRCLMAFPPHGLLPDAAAETFNQFGRSKMFSAGNLSMLPDLTLPISRHGRDWARFHYRNCYVTLHAGQPPQVAPLASLDYTIRAEHLIDRPFALRGPLTEPGKLAVAAGAPGWRGSCFGDFLVLLSADLDDDNTAAHNPAKFRYLQQLIGYLLHDHRRQGATDFAVILCDDETGRTGKGVLIKAIERLTKVCKLDCKNERQDFSPDDLSTATRVKVYNDVTQTFNFKTLYNEITDGGSIRHIHRPPIPVAYDDTWKVLVTSNFVIRGNTESDRGRQRVFDVTPFFNSANKPDDHFQHSFFNDWDTDDWGVFDNIMLSCAQAWLDCRYALQVHESASYRARHIENEYPALMREYLDGIPEGWHPTGDLYKNFIGRAEVQANKFCRDMSPVKFSARVLEYYKAVGRNPSKNPGRTKIYVGLRPPPPPADADEPPPPPDTPPPGTQPNLPF